MEHQVRTCLEDVGPKCCFSVVTCLMDFGLEVSVSKAEERG